MSKTLLPLVAIALLSLSARAATPPPRETFEVAGHTAYVHAAPTPAEGRPWVWYAPTLRGVSIAGRRMYAEAFMEAGIGIAGYDLGEVRGAPASTAKFTRFYEAMVDRGFSKRPILLGQSRGGMMTLAWAVRHPDKVRAWVGIYPVCNLASWPLERSEKQTLADFGLTRQVLEARLAEFNPVDNLAGLAANRVPLFVVHGDNDVVVPYDDNTRILKERYEAAGGPCTVKVVAGEGHKETPSFFECRELVDFVLEQAR